MSSKPALRAFQFIDPAEALGRAVNLLQAVQPFADYDFGTFVRVLMGQIRRHHCIFTLAGDRPVGYVGWALCTEQTARRWLDGGKAPTFAECSGGDCWLGLTWYAVNAQVSRAQTNVMRAIYPSQKLFGIRDYGSHRRSAMVLNRLAEPASPNPAHSPIEVLDPFEGDGLTVAQRHGPRIVGK